ncbi:heptaprenyl diphosphate synthase component 1 [Paenibacillus qinlingensis]|uniref:heptaprenyl diphosphate synthase component 1 n=1 Tax=Paenibacillus qinlingensis TaxID=1837343 RepID=UPI00156406DD|nr:heptaprenyl diphosphate synthase component 1 [Paenibacillus qinlingensis]NQX59008.1 heptaprenyl diphosphate synthase component 1 [Paenibacillus qinlingensis]
MNSYRIPEIAKQYTEYDMIQIHTDLPDFPELRTRLLFAFLNENNKLSSLSELFTVATALVQLGLDTHDLVTASNEVKEKKASRSRQLKVLAGDYFSARFYHLLAKTGQIDMIKQLSNAICEVNRLKMSSYTKMKQLKLTAEDYIHLSVEIKSQLFLSFSEVMYGANKQAWPEILRGFVRCELLFTEIFRIETISKFKGSWGYWHISQNGTREERKLLQGEEVDTTKVRTLLHKYNISSQLYQLLNIQSKQLQDFVKKLESDRLQSELFHMGEPFLRWAGEHPKVLEEI